MDEATKEAVAPVLGRTPSGVFILTAADGSGNETGMLASWVQQASFEPPMITVGINKSRYINDWIKDSPKIALSLVGESQKNFLGHFGRGFEPDQPAFEDVNILQGENGLPVLADAPGYMEGDIINQIESGDHIIYLVKITSAGSSDSLESEKPMVHIRKNGFHY